MRNFLTIEGQIFGQQLSETGEKAIWERLESNRGHEFVAACEFISIAMGNRPTHDYWSAPACAWLDRTSFEPSNLLVEKAIREIEGCYPNDELSELSNVLAGKTTRRKKKLFRPISIYALKRMVKEHYFTNGDVFLNDGEVNVAIAGRLNIKLMVALGYLQNPLNLTVDFLGESPSESDADALRSLLIGTANTLQCLNFHADYRRVAKRHKDPMHFLSLCLRELSLLSNLKSFSSKRLFLDDDCVSAITHGRSLDRFSAEPALEVEITEKAVPYFEKCTSLRYLNIQSSRFDSGQAHQLLKTFPSLNVSIGDFSAPRA